MAALTHAKVRLIYGTDTGNTESVGVKIQQEFEDKGISIECIDVNGATKEDFDDCDLLILGIPTWDFGGIQADWEDFEAILNEIDFSKSLVALYGLGDQFGYGDYFVDAMGWLYQIIAQKGGEFIGRWSTEGYDFEASLACVDGKDYFVGLAVDEDQQFELTDKRVKTWVDQIMSEYEQKTQSQTLQELAH